MAKLDLTSTASEKSVEIARDFLEKLMAPAVEEVGLLLRDTVALWKFRNQVRVLTKAKVYCERNGISPTAISLKLLCPLLENAALEEDASLQDKWAVLLSNLVDSEQNIESHVFPYVLGQISANEFAFLELVYTEKKRRVTALVGELEVFRADRPSLERRLASKLSDLDERLSGARMQTPGRYNQEVWDLQQEMWKADAELRSLKSNEQSLLRRIATPQVLPEAGLREYEMSNLVRLGLVRTTQETHANSQSLEIPIHTNREYVTVDFDVELESEHMHVLTELGELFLSACTEKSVQWRAPGLDTPLD